MLGSFGRLAGARQAPGALDCQAGRALVRDTLFIPAVSHLPIWSPTSVCVAETVQSALSCLSGVTALYIGTYFDVLVGRGEFSVRLCRGILDLLAILYFGMKSVEGQSCSQITINTRLHQIHFVLSFNSSLGLSVHSVLLPELPLQTEEKLHAFYSFEKEFLRQTTASMWEGGARRL